jgi:ketol-acid reductoisomerase
MHSFPVPRWVPGKTLFPITEAANRGSVVMYLLSDAGQKQSWAELQPCLTKVQC